MSDSQQASDSSRSPRIPRLWRNVSFTLMWTSTAASGFGDRMIMLAALALLGGLEKNVTDSTSIYASTQFFFFLPYILISIPGGWLADRLPRKWIMFGCDEVRGLLLLLAVWMLVNASGRAAIPESYHWRVWMILLGVGVMAAVFNPSRNAIVPQIVPRTSLQAANAIILGINTIASMIGLLVGTNYIIDPQYASSVGNGLIIASLFYIVSGFFFAFLKPIENVLPESAQPTQRRSVIEAVRYIGAHRRVLALVLINILIWASAATVSSGLLGVGKQHYGLQSDPLNEFFGITSAVIGVGMLVGAGVVITMRTRRESIFPLMIGLAMSGFCIILLATIPWMPVTYLSCFGLGFFGNITIITAISMLQSISPNYIRGRVMGMNALANTIFSVTTYFLIWQLPRADVNIIYVMYLLGPGLLVFGVWMFVRHVSRGPMHRKDVNFYYRLARFYSLIWHRVEFIGKANVPLDRPVLLTPNHTAGVDPFLIQSAVPKCIRWVMTRPYRFPILEFFWKAVDPITLDTDEESGNTRDNGNLKQIRQMTAVLKENEVLGIFPEGALQREIRELRELKEGVGMLARRTGATIIPVWISGTPAYHHMLWHFLMPSRSTVAFGEPFVPGRNMKNEQIVAELRDRMVALAKEVERVEKTTE